MQYMIIEHYHPGKAGDIYRRFSEKGRMMPDGVKYTGSWVNEKVSVCYQVMEAESTDLLQQWIDSWKDLVDFEIIPVISSEEARKKVLVL